MKTKLLIKKKAQELFNKYECNTHLLESLETIYIQSVYKVNNKIINKRQLLNLLILLNNINLLDIHVLNLITSSFFNGLQNNYKNILIANDLTADLFIDTKYPTYTFYTQTFERLINVLYNFSIKIKNNIQYLYDKTNSNYIIYWDGNKKEFYTNKVLKYLREKHNFKEYTF